MFQELTPSLMAAEAAVIMSVYKNDKALDVYNSINSILYQEYKDFVFLISIDGDIKGDVDTLLKIFEVKDARVLIIKNKDNHGLAWCMNQLIDKIVLELPSVEYIFRMDADDISMINRMKVQTDFLKTHQNIDVLGSACYEFGMFNKIIKKYEQDSEIKKNIIKVTPFIHPSVVFRRNVLQGGIRYPANTILSEDLALWLQLSLDGYVFYNLPNALICYRLTKDTLKRRVSLKKAKSEAVERIRFIFKNKRDISKNIIYVIAHFIIRNLPVNIIKVFYKTLR